MTGTVTIHIGLHKTGTTTLQNRVFPACPELNFLCTDNDGFLPFYRYAAYSDPIYFEPQKAHALLAGMLRPDKPNLLSNEGFSGPLHSGDLEYGLDHRDAVLRNLAAAFPDARVILTLRRQDGLARSLYRQYLRSGGTRGVERYYGFAANTPHQPLFNRDRFRYLPYVRRVEELFPQGLLLLAYEELVRDPDAYLGRISEFLDVTLPPLPKRKDNATRLGPFGLGVTRVLNHFFRSYLNPAGLVPGVPRLKNGKFSLVSPVTLLHEYWPFGYKGGKTGKPGVLAARILEECREDNRALDERYALNLKEYGYY
ncbi:sulfotransferase [Paucidesulfovibrio longus]|uniref:sulfotransferase n=1 Tax=Paucidesulfovibrio longus TaxID=889 RepID=UPI0003B72066|nr:sulfotransferase [Paucidesulfovibrio longus]